MDLEQFQKNPKLVELTNNEVQTLQSLDHQNVIKFVEILQHQHHLYLVYEYCQGGNLEELLNNKDKRQLAEQEALKMFSQIVNGYQSLQHNNILHRDLKPSNILMHNGQCKIADFGFCKTLLHDKDLTKTMIGSPIYMAPEALKGNSYNINADIWSLGVILFELLYGYCPYEDRTIQRLVSQIDTSPLFIPPSNLYGQITYSTIQLLKQSLSVHSTSFILSLLLSFILLLLSFILLLQVDPNRRIKLSQLMEQLKLKPEEGVEESEGSEQLELVLEHRRELGKLIKQQSYLTQAICKEHSSSHNNSQCLWMIQALFSQQANQFIHLINTTKYTLPSLHNHIHHKLHTETILLQAIICKINLQLNKIPNLFDNHTNKTKQQQIQDQIKLYLNHTSIN